MNKTAKCQSRQRDKPKDLVTMRSFLEFILDRVPTSSSSSSKLEFDVGTRSSLDLRKDLIITINRTDLKCQLLLGIQVKLYLALPLPLHPIKIMFSVLQRMRFLLDATNKAATHHVIEDILESTFKFRIRTFPLNFFDHTKWETRPRTTNITTTLCTLYHGPNQ